MSLASGQIDLTWTEQDGMTRTLKAVNVDASVVPDPSIPVLPTPSITGVDPASGTAGGHVWLTGDFTGVTDVAFGTVSASGLAVIDSSTIELVVPEGLSGRSCRSRRPTAGQLGDKRRPVRDRHHTRGFHRPAGLGGTRTAQARRRRRACRSRGL